MTPWIERTVGTISVISLIIDLIGLNLASYWERRTEGNLTSYTFFVNVASLLNEYLVHIVLWFSLRYRIYNSMLFNIEIRIEFFSDVVLR